MPQFRLLGPGDEAALEAFLARYADTTMFLRSNLRSGGIVDQGKPQQATYAACCVDGEIAAVASQAWNGNIMIQAPVHCEPLVRFLAEANVRPVKGFVGPAPQVDAAREALGLVSATARFESCEGLFSLDLADLRVPKELAEGHVQCRNASETELELLAEWRAQSSLETLNETDNAEFRQQCRESIGRMHAQQSLWVVTKAGQPVAMSTFNAKLPDCVQIGGVFTPVALRQRGYARCSVAGSLLAARRAGVTRSILFTSNPFARRAYEALGFREIGTYALVFLTAAHSPGAGGRMA